MRKSILLLPALALALSSCSKDTPTIRDPEPIFFSCPNYEDNSEVPAYSADLKNYKKGGIDYQAMATLNENGYRVLYIDEELIAQKAREIGMEEEDIPMYINAILFHEKCVHAYEYQETVYFENPMTIPSNFSGVGEEIVGTRGSYLVVKMENGNERPLIGYKEMLAMYFMYNNPYVSPEFKDKYGPLLPQWNLYLIADALDKTGSVDFEEVLNLYHSPEYDNQLKAWELLTGHSLFSLNTQGVPFVLPQALSLSQSTEIQSQLYDKSFATSYYYNNFQDVTPGEIK